MPIEELASYFDTRSFLGSKPTSMVPITDREVIEIRKVKAQTE